MGAGDDGLRFVALDQQLAHDGRADDAAIPCNVDSGGLERIMVSNL